MILLGQVLLNKEVFKPHHQTDYATYYDRTHGSTLYKSTTLFDERQINILIIDKISEDI